MPKRTLYNDETDYKQLLRLVSSVLAKKDKSIVKYAMNTYAKTLINLEVFSKDFLEQENLEFLEKYFEELGKAQFVNSLDAISQMVIKLQSTLEQKNKKKEENKLSELWK